MKSSGKTNLLTLLLGTKLSKKIEYYEYLIGEVTSRAEAIERDLLKTYEELANSKQKLTEEFLDVSNKANELEEQVEQLVIENHRLSDRCLQLEQTKDEMKKILNSDHRFTELEKSVSSMYAFVLRKQEGDDELTDPYHSVESRFKYI